jgi:alkaline phosphatase D
MTFDPTRRDLMAGLAVAAIGASGAHAQEAQPLRRFAFGACARQNKDQPVWLSVAAEAPELFVFLGDCVYGDTNDPEELGGKYAQLAGKPEFQALRKTTPFLTIWDDHDYGTNDCGVEHPNKDNSRAQFCDFWGVPPDSDRRRRADGIYTSELIGPPGQDVRFIVPDLRWNRTKLRRPAGFAGVAATYLAGQIASGREVRGPYRASREDAATMIGEAQWAWLEAEFAKPAALRVLCSSLQVLSEGSGWEAWENYPADLARLLELVGDAQNVVILSGDVHYGEISKLDRNGAPPLWEVTSSGITESDPLLPNRRRVAAHKGRNFGLVDIDWPARSLDLHVRGAGGEASIAQRVAFG